MLSDWVSRLQTPPDNRSGPCHVPIIMLTARGHTILPVPQGLRLLQSNLEMAQEVEAANRKSQAYARDLRIAFDAEKLRTLELERFYHDTILRLIRAAEYRHEAHTQRLGHYTIKIADYLSLDKFEANLNILIHVADRGTSVMLNCICCSERLLTMS